MSNDHATQPPGRGFETLLRSPSTAPLTPTVSAGLEGAVSPSPEHPPSSRYGSGPETPTTPQGFPQVGGIVEVLDGNDWRFCEIVEIGRSGFIARSCDLVRECFTRMGAASETSWRWPAASQSELKEALAAAVPLAVPLPARAPVANPICTCGHRRAYHDQGYGNAPCLAEIDRGANLCECPAFKGLVAELDASDPVDRRVPAVVPEDRREADWNRAELAAKHEHERRLAENCPMTALGEVVDAASWGESVYAAGLPALEARELAFDELSESPALEPDAVSLCKDLSDRHVTAMIRNSIIALPGGPRVLAPDQLREWHDLARLSVGGQRATVIRCANLHLKTLAAFLKATALALIGCDETDGGAL